MVKRGYQHNFSNISGGMYDVVGRERKAKTMVAVLTDYFQSPLNELTLLNVGSSTGLIDNYLSNHFQSIVGVDIDDPAIEHAKRTFHKTNLEFQVGDALNLHFPDDSFDVVICSQVYEHVPFPQKMLNEIFRVLTKGGVCYFAATNKLMWREPHYNLPLLSLIPRPLAHLYVRLTGKAKYYHELHYTYWGLKKLVRNFHINDYTLKAIRYPLKYHTDYMIPPGSMKAAVAMLIAKNFQWLSPGYIWVLEKPTT
ncbi:MAG: class I SAM-dependent methyltransferase [Desulfobulbaceae bacterium]|nr:class I SAM-dependent methyltransferase [Desulfobulbaceae bacterium]